MWAWSCNVGRTGAGQKEYEEESTLKGVPGVKTGKQHISYFCYYFDQIPHRKKLEGLTVYGHPVHHGREGMTVDICADQKAERGYC